MENLSEEAIREFTEIVKEVVINANESEALTTLINNGMENSLFRNLGEVDFNPDINESGNAVYPMIGHREPIIHVMPMLGYCESSEVVFKDIEIPIYSVQAAKDWAIKYMENRAIQTIMDVVADTIEGLKHCEDSAGFKLLFSSVAKGFDGAGIYKPVLPQIYEMPTGDPSAGYFSREIVNRIITAAYRYGKQLKMLWISPEDMADIREYTPVDADPETRREIFQASGMGYFWGIELRVLNQLGIRGEFNINGFESEYGELKVTEDRQFYDYMICHPNIVNEYGELQTAGETQFLAFADDIDQTFKMPIKETYKAYWDTNLFRRQRSGFFGWQKYGMGLVGKTSVFMGVVDRAMQDVIMDESGYMKIKPHRRYTFPSLRY